ncbi:MAG TPA: phosphatase PAP2 family protein [Ilumatobacteraceae bacterium]|nr:phosphatase PAP2 family protein [Ilumatobacteraceae bacterium]
MSAVASFDSWGDEQLERLRGHALADKLFISASFVGEFSGIWHVIGVGRAIIDPSKWRQALALSALIGAESLVVNQGVKRLFRRIRPTESGDPRYRVRRPTTSSFPSGHASAGFFAAAILTTATGPSLAPVWYSLAVVIAVSRVYVRVHHLSDIVGGAALGAALGVAGSRVFSLLVL